MKFIFKIVHSRFDLSDAVFSFKLILLEKLVGVKVVSILNLIGAVCNLYHIRFFLFAIFRKYLGVKVGGFGLAPTTFKLSIIFVGFNPVQGLYLVL
jgi:hypothetical protein